MSWIWCSRDSTTTTTDDAGLAKRRAVSAPTMFLASVRGFSTVGTRPSYARSTSLQRRTLAPVPVHSARRLVHDRACSGDKKGPMAAGETTAWQRRVGSLPSRSALLRNGASGQSRGRRPYSRKSDVRPALARPSAVRPWGSIRSATCEGRLARRAALAAGRWCAGTEGILAAIGY